jgi:hypothetical protein
MSWTDRLIRLATGDPQQMVREALLKLHFGSAERAQRLAADAELSPTAAAETMLRELAAREHERGEALRLALRQRGHEPSPVPAPAGSGGHNHWARLVADLEACRLARDQLVRERAALLERDDSLADLLDSVLAGLDAQAAALRTLIARSDPQALD